MIFLAIYPFPFCATTTFDISGMNAKLVCGRILFCSGSLGPLIFVLKETFLWTLGFVHTAT
jgi:hypothetical protein